MKPFAAEQADADPPLEGDADRHALGGAQERVLLADQLAAELLQIHRQDLARVRRGERHLLLAAAAVGEHGHEQALAGDQPLAGAEQRAHDARPLSRCRRRTRSPSRCRASCTSSSRLRRPRSRPDRARLRRTASRCRGSGSRSRARGGRDDRRRHGAARAALPPVRYAASSGTSLSGVQFFMPAVNTSVLPSIVPFRRLVITSSCETGPTWWPPMAMYHCCCDIRLLRCVGRTCQVRSVESDYSRLTIRPTV